jgi:hypothetical protein
MGEKRMRVIRECVSKRGANPSLFYSPLQPGKIMDYSMHQAGEGNKG